MEGRTEQRERCIVSAALTEGGAAGKILSPQGQWQEAVSQKPLLGWQLGGSRGQSPSLQTLGDECDSDIGLPNTSE